MKRRFGNHGFTLLELLVSLTILAVIVGMVSGAMSVGVRAWEKGERDIDTHQKQRIVLDLMKRQLMSASPGAYQLDDDETLRLRGEEKILELVSEKPLSPENEYGKVYARYVVASDGDEGEALSFYEENIALLGEDFDPDHLDKDLYHELLTGVHRVRFEYMKGEKDDDPEWKDEWDPDDDEGPPLAVKITFQEEPDDHPVEVIARIVDETTVNR